MIDPRRALQYLREKNLHLWLPGYVKRRLLRTSRSGSGGGPRHLLFAVCDHHEPLWGEASLAQGEDRMRAWVEGYPSFAEFRDADGRPPRHTFFFPGEQYHPQFLDSLARLARADLGEVEFHLHHDRDTAENLRRTIREHLALFAGHGHLSCSADGALRYAFIHGNWCLANARRDGRYCGVDAEIPLLFETGCYADFTFPAAPDESQGGIVNQIYWPMGDLSRRRAYDQGEPARVGTAHRDRLLIIQGPLALGLRRSRMPLRIETGHLTGVDPASPSRVRSWVQEDIHVEGRPEWVFVKVHTHGAPEHTARSLLGEGGRALHRELAGHYNDGSRWALHYCTARELYNIAMAAMDGRSGNPGEYRDYLLPAPPVARTRTP